MNPEIFDQVSKYEQVKTKIHRQSSRMFWKHKPQQVQKSKKQQTKLIFGASPELLGQVSKSDKLKNTNYSDFGAQILKFSAK